MVEREDTATAQLKIRLRESVRAQLELAAKDNSHTLNKEIVDRLETSLSEERMRGGRSAEVFQIAVGTAIRIAQDITGNDWRYDYPTYEAARGIIIEALDKYRPPDLSVLKAKKAELDARQAELDAMRSLSIALEEKLKALPPPNIHETPALPAEAMIELQPLLDAVQASKAARQGAEAAVEAAQIEAERKAEESTAKAATVEKLLEREAAKRWLSSSPD